MHHSASDSFSVGVARGDGRAAVTALLRASLAAFAILLSSWAGAPFWWLVSLAMVSVSAISAEVAALREVPRFARLALFSTWLWSLVGALSLALAAAYSGLEKFLDFYWAGPVLLIAGTLFPAAHLMHRLRPGTRWKLPSAVWAGWGVALLLEGSYRANARTTFYAGVVVAVGLLIIYRVSFRLHAVPLQIINTLILLAVAFPVIDLLLQPHHSSGGSPANLRSYYCYRTAKTNPAAFERWWRYFWIDQWVPAYDRVVIRNPGGVPQLRPNSHARLVDSEIDINSKGFRGTEIADFKGQTYRIVALGESSTFGLTINRDDKPWPEMLQNIIQKRLNPDRPVEVINAGFPGLTLADNLERMHDQILPLKPDMIISYHGINGFRLLDRAMPSIHGRSPPRYVDRPIKLLAQCEFRVKLLWYRHCQAATISRAPPTFADIEQSRYARAYGELIDIARTNRIRLVLANFSMAVNEQSPPSLVEFFRSRTPQPYWYIRANAEHSRMLKELAEENPGVGLVNTHPHLDGVEDKFIDLVHFAHGGEEQMAENMFEGIEPTLLKDLGYPLHQVETNTLRHVLQLKEVRPVGEGWRKGN